MAHAQRTTDWDNYYSRPYKTASLTRKYTASVLTRLMRSANSARPAILELGGANSCFIDQVLAEIDPVRYDVLDNNSFGLRLLKSKFECDSRVRVINGDVLALDPIENNYDIVFSVGLIEHFDKAGTECAIEAHFSPLRPGGMAIITFPTPTLLYRSIRRVAELTKQWIFHDERPLLLEEVAAIVQRRGCVTYSRILWPLILTQYCIAIHKHGT